MIGHNKIPAEVHEATEFFRTFAEKYERISQDAIWKEEYKKIVKANLFLAAKGTVGERESSAIASPEYEKAAREHAAASAKEKALELDFKAREWTLKLYQTSSRNERGS